MSTFTFKGITSDSLGLIITRPMVRPTWAPEVEFTAIPGNPRKSSSTKSWYNNSRLTVRAVIADASTSSVRAIYSALKGYGTLIISTASEEVLNAYVKLPVPEAQALLMAELPIEFECEPFAYALTDSEVTITSATSSYAEVPNGGTAFTDPQITYIASAASTNIDCNGVVMTVTTPTEIVNASYPSTYSITLDCEAQLAYYTKPNGDTVACTELTTGLFPRLHAGSNWMKHSGAQSMTVTYRERWF